MTKRATPSFSSRCYSLLREIPKGRVTTYQEIARALDTRAFRAVGSAMGRNPDAPVVPCHRVVKSDGSLGGYAGGQRKKISLLQDEGIEFEGGKVKNFDKVIYKFKDR